MKWGFWEQPAGRERGVLRAVRTYIPFQVSTPLGRGCARGEHGVTGAHFEK